MRNIYKSINVSTLLVGSSLGGLHSKRQAADVINPALFSEQLGKHHFYLNRQSVLEPPLLKEKHASIAALNKQISSFTCWQVLNEKPFLVIGGDHSCAMGTWAGVLNALGDKKRLGLLWLDAHMDAHTFATSPSGNVHGMPVAALLGEGGNKLQYFYPSKKFISGQNLILFGVRSYESEEKALLEEAGVMVYTMDKIDRLGGIKRAFKQAMAELSEKCDVLAISLDMDCIDPVEAPGVYTPTKDGIKGNDLVSAFEAFEGNGKLAGIEICEFNPDKDKQGKTQHLVIDLIKALLVS